MGKSKRNKGGLPKIHLEMRLDEKGKKELKRLLQAQRAPLEPGVFVGGYHRSFARSNDANNGNSSRKGKNMSKSNRNQVKLSVGLSKRIIAILMNDGMTAVQIGKKIGKSSKFVYDAKNGKAQLSAEDLGSLAGKVGKIIGADTLEKIQKVSKNDVIDMAEKVKDAASTLLANLEDNIVETGHCMSAVVKKYSKKAVPASKKAARDAVSRMGTIFQASGEFLQGVSGKKKG